MAKLVRKCYIIAKTESVYGTNPIPSGTDAVLAEIDPTQFVPIAGNVIYRNNARMFLGAQRAYHVSNHHRIQFSVEAVGSGTVDVPPAWAPLLLACGFSETITASTKVEYRLTSIEAIPSLTIQFWMDGHLFQLRGARGNVRIEFVAEQFPKLHFEFWGIWYDPAETAAASPVYSDYMAPYPVVKGYTTTVNLYSHTTLVLQRCHYDLGNQLIYGNRPPVEDHVRVVDRNVTGEVEFLAPPLSSINWFTAAKAGTKGIISIGHGPTGYRFTISQEVDTVTLFNPKYTVIDGLAHIMIPFQMAPSSAGNDEFKLTTW